MDIGSWCVTANRSRPSPNVTLSRFQCVNHQIYKPLTQVTFYDAIDTARITLEVTFAKIRDQPSRYLALAH